MSQLRAAEFDGHTDEWAALPRLIDASPLPVALLELPEGTILAVSDSALDVIGQDRAVVGRRVDDLTADPPSGGFDLVLRGRLSGYETTRLFTTTQGERAVRVWVRAVCDVPPVRLAVAVLAHAGELRAGLRMLDPTDVARVPVIGTADRTLSIERISAEVEQVLGVPAGDVLNRPILQFIAEPYAGALLLALAEATATGRGTSVASGLVRPDGTVVPVEVSLVPLTPAPSFAFALADTDTTPMADDAAARRLLHSVGQIIESTDTSRGVAARCPPVAGLEKLTSRELHIVERLMDGDRVPAIAASLFLSQSTVRNHLSSVFRKLGVTSQQQLISLLRAEKRRSA